MHRNVEKRALYLGFVWCVTDVVDPFWAAVPAADSRKRGEGCCLSPRLHLPADSARTLWRETSNGNEISYHLNRQCYRWNTADEARSMREKNNMLKQEAVVRGAGITLRAKALLFWIFTFEGAEQRVLWCHIEAQRCVQILSAITTPGVVILPWHGPQTTHGYTWLT